MINTLIEGIACKLNEGFPDITIYSEKVPQNFKTPSFYIKCLTHSDSLLLSGNKRKITNFDIMYFPSEGAYNKEKELNGVLDKLVENMRLIEAGGYKIKAYDISAKKVDDVLHYFVSYNFINLKNKENVKMEILEQHGSVKMENLEERNGVNGS